MSANKLADVLMIGKVSGCHEAMLKGFGKSLSNLQGSDNPCVIGESPMERTMRLQRETEIIHKMVRHIVKYKVENGIEL